MVPSFRLPEAVSGDLRIGKAVDGPPILGAPLPPNSTDLEQAAVCEGGNKLVLADGSVEHTDATPFLPEANEQGPIDDLPLTFECVE